ncbi:MAG: energy-coupling factor ABC transporter ATP-binding protein [Halanaerobiaceae bacterium]
MSRILVNDLFFHYQEETPVLIDVNLELDRGTVAIIGQNGAGKTTFVKLLKGLLKPVQGEIFINGNNIKEKSAASLAGEIGLVFQNPSDQIFKNNVLAEVMFGPINLGFNEDEAEERARKAISRVNLEEVTGENPYDLSLAERKLITIASILAMDPEIIIFDEPTIGQDYKNIELIKRIIREEEKKDKLIITINHDMDFVAEVFNRVIVFNQGQILIDGNAREVFSREDILQKAHLDLPSLQNLGKELGLGEIILTENEFVSRFKSMF